MPLQGGVIAMRAGLYATAFACCALVITTTQLMKGWMCLRRHSARSRKEGEPQRHRDEDEIETTEAQRTTGKLNHRDITQRVPDTETTS